MFAAIADCRNSTSGLLLCSSLTGHVCAFMLCHMTPQPHKTSREQYAAQQHGGAVLVLGPHRRKKVVGWNFGSGTLCAELACSAGGCEGSHQVLTLKHVGHKHQANGLCGDPNLATSADGSWSVWTHRFPSNSRCSRKPRL